MARTIKKTSWDTGRAGLIFLIILIPLFGYADTLSGLIVKIESLYNQGQYKIVLENVDEVLRTTKTIPDSTMIRLYTYQAFSYVALDNKKQALVAFRYLLIINPKMELDPKFISPKIIEVFEESKRIRGDSLRLFPPPFLPMDKVQSHMVRNQAIRSLLYPGLGQLYQQKRTKGYLFLGGETFSLLGLFGSHLLTNSAHQKYLNNRNINEMDKLYNNYSLWYRTRTGFIISSIGIWIINYIDATLSN